MMRWLRGKDHVRHFSVDAARYESLGRHSLIGTQAVPVDRIVGSVGRAHEFGSNFRSCHTWDGDLRYHKVRELMKGGVAFPPAELYLLEDRYYVVDGHHRVAAARSLGQLYIEALVTEFRPMRSAADGSPVGGCAA